MKPRTPTISRRRLLTRTLSAASALLLLGPRRVLAHARRAPLDPPHLLAALFPDRQSAAAIGLRHLERHPEDADRASLMHDYFADAPVTASAWLRRVHAQHVEDLRSGALAVVDGWVLSRTEARLCAAAALLPSTPHDR